MEMENEKGMVCDICGCHKGGHYRWARLVLAVLLGLFIFLAGIQIGEMRSEVDGYQGHMMRWDDGGNMMWNGQEGTTTIMVAPPTTQTVPTTPATTTPTKSTVAPTTGTTTPATR